MSTSTPDPAALQADLDRLALQEARLQLARFDADSAWGLGLALRDAAKAQQVAVTIEIRIGEQTVFFHAMPGTAPVNADWARRKRNVSELMDESSYRVGRRLALEGGTLEAKLGVPTRDYAAHGGAVPLRIAGTRIGTVTVSGLPQRADHVMVIEALAILAGVPLAEIALAG